MSEQMVDYWMNRAHEAEKQASRWRKLATGAQALLRRVDDLNKGLSLDANDAAFLASHTSDWLADYDAALADSPVVESKEQRYRDALEKSYRETHALCHAAFDSDGKYIEFKDCSLWVCKKNRAALTEDEGVKEGQDG